MTRHAYVDPERDSPVKRLARQIHMKEEALAILPARAGKARQTITAELHRARILLRTAEIERRLR